MHASSTAVAQATIFNFQRTWPRRCERPLAAQQQAFGIILTGSASLRRQVRKV